MAKKKKRKQPQNTGANSDSPAGKGRVQSRRAQRVIEQKRARRRRMFLMVGGAVGLALVAVLALVLLNRDSEGAASNEPVTEAPPLNEDVEMEGRAMGDPNAPVTVIEYGDFQ